MSIRQYLKTKINSIKNIIKNSLYKINEFFLFENIACDKMKTRQKRKLNIIFKIFIKKYENYEFLMLLKIRAFNNLEKIILLDL